MPVIFKHTFPHSRQQVQATVCVQSLQQVSQSLRVRVVQLETHEKTNLSISKKQW